MKLRIIMTVPNLLTLIRLLATPVLAWHILTDAYPLQAFLLFAGIWATDMLDGFIARRFNQVSEFGKLFDPLVDKLFQLTTAVSMFVVGKLPVWVLLFIAIKELFMIIGGVILLKEFETIVYARWYGKLATVLFAAAFAAMFFLPAASGWLAHYIFLPPVLCSLYAYVRYGINFLRLRRKTGSQGSAD